MYIGAAFDLTFLSNDNKILILVANQGKKGGFATWQSKFAGYLRRI